MSVFTTYWKQFDIMTKDNSPECSFDSLCPSSLNRKEEGYGY